VGKVLLLFLQPLSAIH